MDSSQVVTSFFAHPKNRLGAKTRRRANDYRVKELYQYAKSLIETPANWDMFCKIEYAPSPEQLKVDLEELPGFTKQPEEQRVLTKYLEYSFSSYLDDPDQSDYLVIPYLRNVVNFIKTGSLPDLNMMMESAFFLYALGPFTELNDPWHFLSKEHEDYRRTVRNFGVKASRLCAEEVEPDNPISMGADLVTTYFDLFGDTFRTFAWERQ